jgi:signal transduction histidine kinase/DNA-binding response OmpR family regulator/HPt (histidine-containing phosphotransfer) domain-containing protein/HAMP domain-containing protein
MGRFSGLSLRVKAMIVVLFVIAIASGVGGWRTTSLISRLILRGEQDKVSAMAQSLARAVELPLAVQDEAELSRLTKGFLRDEDVLFAAIYDNRNHLLAKAVRNEGAFLDYQSNGKVNPEVLFGEQTVELTAAPDEFSVFAEGGSGAAKSRPNRAEVAPELPVVGRVVLGHSTASVRVAQHNQMRTTVITLVPAAMISFVVVFWAVKAWTRRLDNLVEASERISSGDLTHPIWDPRSDEIGRLSHAYEHMRQAIYQRDLELRNFNDTLLQRVDERTAELTKTNDELKREVSVRQRAEYQLEQSLSLVTATLESTADGILVVDNSGKIAIYNQRFVDMWNIPDEVLAAREDEKILQVIRRQLTHGEAFVRRVRELYAQGDEEGFDVLELKDGRTFERYAKPQLLAGRTVGRVWCFHDVTRQKQAERELLKAKEAAESASRSKSEFLANMSHEIRTPMNGVIGMTELALDTDLTDEQRDYLNMVRESAESLLTVINDILDFSKIEAGKLDLEPIDFNLRDCVYDTARAMAVRSEKRGLELICHIMPDVPVAIVGDPGRLRQVLVNLIGNAVKFTDQGEVGVRVELKSRTDDHVVLRFFVSNTGIGIPPEKQKDIFRAFEQADGSTTRKFGGTGLGLAISARLVRLMGGRVAVESEVGRGSTFRFTARFGLQQAGGFVAEPVEADRLRGLRVLVVDDNATNRRIFQETLRSWHMEPTLAAGGAEAIRLMQGQRDADRPFPLVLLDVNMPEMDGFAVAEEIRSHSASDGVKIIMMTSAGRRGDAARSRKLGIEAYLIKPVKRSDLLNAILTAFGTRFPTEEGRPAQARPLAASGRGLHVLLAEDNLVNQKLASRLLEKQAYTVTVVGNGMEAMAALEKEQFDLVLMDVQMPEMSGFEATVAIRDKEEQTGGHLPIIAMTAHAMTGDREKCLNAGMDGYISKPISLPKLLKAIDEVVEGESAHAPGGETRQQPAPSPDQPPFDKGAALDGLGGDEEVLREMATAFLADCPRTLANLRQALTDGDAERITAAAHSLKGAVGYFAAEGALEAARKVETAAGEGDLKGAQEAFAQLSVELSRLTPALEAVVEPHESRVQ